MKYIFFDNKLTTMMALTPLTYVLITLTSEADGDWIAILIAKYFL
jgi:hypothetical protein